MLLLLAAFAARACPVSPGAWPRLVPVASGVWRVPAAGAQADAGNAGATIQLVLVRDRARLWLIGSGPTPAAGAALACAIRRTTGLGVSDVINTRATPELALGNVAFAGARLWALADVIAAMRTRCTQCLERLKAQIGAAGNSLVASRIRPPTRAIGGERRETGQIGPFTWQALARRPGERTLVLRHQQLLIAQGLVWTDEIPDLRDTRIETMTASLQRLRGLASGARVIGERGEPAPAAAVDDHLAYLEALRRAVAPQLAHGDAATATAPLPAFADRLGYATVHPLNVQRIWRELEDAQFR